MIKTKKLLTVLLTGVLALLTLIAGAFIPAKAEEPETTIKKVSVLDTGGVSFLFYYGGDPTKVENTNTIEFIFEEGITAYNQAVGVKSTWAGDMGLWSVSLYIMVDLNGTPYENYNNITIELSSLALEAWVEGPDFVVDPETGEDVYEKTYVVGENYTEEDSSSLRCFRIQKANEYPHQQAVLSDGAFTTTIEKEDVEKRFTLYNDNNIFKNVMSENSDFEDETEIPPLGADVEVTFNFACWVEIDEDKIGVVDKGENEETTGDKLETWLNETGDKISSFLQEKTGVAVGGTSSIVVLVIVAIIVIRRLKRR